MGGTYYYFAASLPMIRWGGKLSQTVEEFLEDARRLLSEKDFVLMEGLLLGKDGIETDNTAALSWITFDRNFRNEIAFFRAREKHKDPLKSIRGNKEDEPVLREAVHEASRMPDLLEAQKSLDEIRWQFLEDLCGGHYYDLEFLICYGLKLKILEQYENYQSPKGGEIFDHIQAMKLPLSWISSGE